REGAERRPDRGPHGYARRSAHDSRRGTRRASPMPNARNVPTPAWTRGVYSHGFSRASPQDARAAAQALRGGLRTRMESPVSLGFLRCEILFTVLALA